jgi:hypothetical protein
MQVSPASRRHHEAVATRITVPHRLSFSDALIPARLDGARFCIPGAAQHEP